MSDKKPSLEDYPIIEKGEDKPRAYYVKYPLEYNGKWICVDVTLTNGYFIRPNAIKFDTEEEAEVACNVHNEFHGFDKEFVDKVVSISMKNSLENEDY